MSKYFAHETTVIDLDVKSIGDDTKIWHFCHICAGAQIGKNCVLGQNVYVGPRVKIGNNVKIQNNVSVYEGVTLKDFVFVGPSVVFTNVKMPRSLYPSPYKITLVCSGVSIGANATILPGIIISDNAVIGAGAVVTKDVFEDDIVIGIPAKSMDDYTKSTRQNLPHP